MTVRVIILTLSLLLLVPTTSQAVSTDYIETPIGQMSVGTGSDGLKYLYFQNGEYQLARITIGQRGFIGKTIKLSDNRLAVLIVDRYMARSCQKTDYHWIILSFYNYTMSASFGICTPGDITKVSPYIAELKEAKLTVTTPGDPGPDYTEQTAADLLAASKERNVFTYDGNVLSGTSYKTNKSWTR